MGETTDDMVCPHCKTNVPRNASVCRGCQAEIHRGIPTFIGWTIFIVGLVGAFIILFKVIGPMLPPDISGWIAFGLGLVLAIAIWVLLTMLAGRMFKDRVVFLRVYKTTD